MTDVRPGRMIAPPRARAPTPLTAASGAPAVLVEVVPRRPRPPSTATGVDDVDTGTAAHRGQTYEVGSQSKMMTAVVVLQLADEGLIDLDARSRTSFRGR